MMLYFGFSLIAYHQIVAFEIRKLEDIWIINLEQAVEIHVKNLVCKWLTTLV
jgi:hypothetical protein